MKKISMQQSTKKITFEKAFDQFIRQCKVKNLSDETIKYYERCRNSFAKFFDTNSPCEIIDRNLFFGYIEFLQEQDITDVTVNTNLRGLRAILNFCMENDYVEHFKMKLMKIDKPIKETYTEEQLAVLLKKPNLKECGFVEYRTWTMINFVMGTGQRLSSMLNIRVGDISLFERQVIIRKAKGRKQLIIPLSSGLCKILQEYLQYRGEETENYIFPNQFGGQLSTKGAEDAMSDYNRARGVASTSIHLYRHTFAKMWILNGGDIFSLQKMLGHSSLEMVKEYVNLFGGELHKQYDQFNPLDSLQTNEKKTAMKVKKKSL